MDEAEAAAARREQITAFVNDRRNRVLIELGDRARTDLVAENSSAAMEWRAGIVSGRAWNAQHRP